MNGIYHKIGILSESENVIEALTTKSGLASWWTEEVDGEFKDGKSNVGEMIRFTFGEKGKMEMKVKTIESDAIKWECITGPEEWLGSHIDFLLKPSNFPDGTPMTIIHFKHEDWKTENEMTGHCSMKWATFLLSLKSLIESGKGRPAPNDLKIDDWN
ncbi:SRPBCC family protein [Leptospira sp. GIMC2001]|uniref:SRPBCC family protein n=1 Tax=Leptospira sp. GIMC2001 TaxID=1513297 RepID=UPI00234A84E7|nr:SRPBCC domain-containing protein [Leptospira sp. GIMC2001]WCL49264.1 SRPBCC domain-containing protein [Leptospira sp. GIMC2001]